MLPEGKWEPIVKDTRQKMINDDSGCELKL